MNGYTTLKLYHPLSKAFNQLNYAFHGYGPGKKSKEKKLQKMQKEADLFSKKETYTNNSIQSLKEAQVLTGAAGVEVGTKIDEEKIKAVAKLQFEKEKEKEARKLAKAKKQ